MPANPLEKSIRSGVRMNGKIGDLFAKLGSSDHPRGVVSTAYRNSRMLIKSAMNESNPLPAVRDVTRSLRRTLQSEIASVLEEAVALGEEEARRQMVYYQDDEQSGYPIDLTDETQTAAGAILARYDSQSAAINAILMTNGTLEQIIGDGVRSGVLSSSEILAAASNWASRMVWSAFDATAALSSFDYKKQAVAALDGRTTDCCLRVHAQIQPFNGLFKLTGTPRFADTMDWPGFHYYCRTSGVLYLSQYDDGLTQRMRAGADYFIDERSAGRYPDRDPADAF